MIILNMLMDDKENEHNSSKLCVRDSSKKKEKDCSLEYKKKKKKITPKNTDMVQYNSSSYYSLSNKATLYL